MTGSGERVGDPPDAEAPPAAVPAAAAPAARTRRLPFDAAALKAVRSLVVEGAREAGLDEDRVQDAELVASELTANSVEHGGGRGELWIWYDATQLVIEVCDAGHIADPLAGRRPVPADSIGGRGLLLVHKLADFVRIRTEPGRTVIRAYFTRA
ncbi:Anti-sigma regulatory factor (Ser/Thr protein kinase) [Actinomadura meyerae]|jgi:anti-sigma regulatory factor (Ser/Thr protein kinase)|uniref:Anti-sigma regulatory factor (Ser/Thr protein kinase) n=1 Tax=Actinomadura meyerae TaxID=240840 RepID=A0A239J4G2_9ACTN|nr:ATP-binding protein [Actinomadura meyerae]SNT00737.1 Anti-sigma regulatory factor (Ser/Thr protein kinase) [Actinomadura meyerae]